MNFTELIKEKISKKQMKNLFIIFISLVYIVFITFTITEYSSNILMPDLFENERETVNAMLFISMLFIGLVLFFTESNIIKYMFVYHFVLIFTVLTAIIPYDKRPIIVIPMVLSLLYCKSIGLAGAISVCAYNVFTLSDRPDEITGGPAFMMIVIILILSGTAAILVDKKSKLYFEIPSYSIIYCLSLWLIHALGSYCKDFPGYELFYEDSFKFYASKGVLFSVIGFVIVRIVYYVYNEKVFVKKKIQEISLEDYALVKEMRKNSSSLYRHSVEVAELSARAAKAIGADEDLAFAGGLYHDIGKLSGTNYVQEGIKIVNKFKLPGQIKNIIIEHNVKNRLPKTKEAAIVMLADTAVSAVEYLRTNNKKNVDEVVVFENSMLTRLKNGALNDSTITINEFHVIKDTFMQQKVLNMK